MAVKIENSWRDTLPFWLFVLFVIACALMGGSSRANVQSLIILRPLSAIMLAIACLYVSCEKLAHFKPLMWIFVAWTLLIVAHLIPLPFDVWSNLSGRELPASIDKTLGFVDIWRPLSLIPNATWNSFFALMVPAAVLLFGITWTAYQHEKILLLILLIGIIGAVFGLMQSVSGQDSMLYLYKVSSNTSAVGLFANRNHYAVFMAILFPLLAAYVSLSKKSETSFRRRMIFAILTAIFLFFSIVTTGSRSGLILSLLGIIFAAIVYKKPVFVQSRKITPKKNYIQLLGASSVVFACCLVAIFFSKPASLERLMQGDVSKEVRFVFWKPVLEMANSYQPWGSGIGTFAEVYQIKEPAILMNSAYLNLAHNDWLEIYMTGGIAALVIVTVFVVIVTVQGWHIFSTKSLQKSSGRVQYTEQILARAAFFCIVQLSIASATDYPVRTPFLMVVGVILLIWLLQVRSQSGEQPL